MIPATETGHNLQDFYSEDFFAGTAADLHEADDEYMLTEIARDDYLAQMEALIVEDLKEPLSQLWPEDFALYKSYFVDFWKERGYHQKHSYQTGFLQPKSRKTQLPLHLKWLRYEPLEKHLDFLHYAWHWQLMDPHHYEKYIKSEDRLYWLGLFAGRRTQGKRIKISLVFQAFSSDIAMSLCSILVKTIMGV